jgi:hypothetical protein
VDVEAALLAADSNGLNYLRVVVTLVPSSDQQTAPVLHDWELRYGCEAAQ